MLLTTMLLTLAPLALLLTGLLVEANPSNGYDGMATFFHKVNQLIFFRRPYSLCEQSSASDAGLHSLPGF